MSPFPPNWNAYLAAPLTGSAALRRRLRKEVANVQKLERLLSSCSKVHPKTTPIYLRLIQAYAHWLIDNPSTVPTESKALAVEVAKAVKRFDLTLDP